MSVHARTCTQARQAELKSHKTWAVCRFSLFFWLFHSRISVFQKSLRWQSYVRWIIISSGRARLLSPHGQCWELKATICPAPSVHQSWPNRAPLFGFSPPYFACNEGSFKISSSKHVCHLFIARQGFLLFLSGWRLMFEMTTNCLRIVNWQSFLTLRQMHQKYILLTVFWQYKRYSNL